MTDEEFGEVLAMGRGQAGIEFAGADSRIANRKLEAQVIRAMLSMANRRNGGLVILGVEDEATLVASGMSKGDLATWRYDDLAEAADKFADPLVKFDTEVRSFEGKHFLVIRVYEFADVPVICKRSIPEVLREGICYVRTRRKPETAGVPSEAEMRDLLDMALEKRFRSYVATVEAAGVTLPEVRRLRDEQKYSEQLRDFLEGR